MEPDNEMAGVSVTELGADEVLNAVHRQGLLVLRDQQLDPAGLQRLAARLGDPERYPFADPLPGFPHVVAVVKNPEDTHNFGGAWHSDTTYLARPPSLTLLYAVEVPEQGGDTLFADMREAYEALSSGLRRLLDGLLAHNTSALIHGSGAAHAAVAGQAPTLRRDRQESRALHPVVRVHPVTGHKALFVSRIHTERFDGMTREESLPLIEFLQEFATRPERVFRLRWRPGTLAIWDNRSVQHYPLNDYPGRRREMHRVILKGERPLGPAAA